MGWDESVDTCLDVLKCIVEESWQKRVSGVMNKGKDVTHRGLENREWQELIHPSCKEFSLRCEV